MKNVGKGLSYLTDMLNDETLTDEQRRSIKKEIAAFYRIDELQETDWERSQNLTIGDFFSR